MWPIKCQGQPLPQSAPTEVITVAGTVVLLTEYQIWKVATTSSAATAAGLSTGTGTQTLVTPKGRQTFQMLLSVPGALDHVTTIAEEEQPT